MQSNEQSPFEFKRAALLFTYAFVGMIAYFLMRALGELVLHRQTSGAFVGTLAASGAFVQAVAGPNNTPYSGAPLNQLSIRQISRDRNINDITLENQSEMEAKFLTGPVGHLLLMGLDLNYEQYTNKTFTRNGFCNGFALVAGSAGCTPAGYTVGAGLPANTPPIPGNYASSQAWGLGAYFLFSVLHAAFPLVLQRKFPTAAPTWWGQLFPPLALLLVLGSICAIIQTKLH